MTISWISKNNVKRPIDDSKPGVSSSAASASGEGLRRKNQGDVGEPRNLPSGHNNCSPPYSPIGRKTVTPEDAIRAHRNHCAISAPRREEIDLLTPITAGRLGEGRYGDALCRTDPAGGAGPRGGGPGGGLTMPSSPLPLRASGGVRHG
jgi:hypothetical protein